MAGGWWLMAWVLVPWVSLCEAHKVIVGFPQTRRSIRQTLPNMEPKPRNSAPSRLMYLVVMDHPCIG